MMRRPLVGLYQSGVAELSVAILDATVATFDENGLTTNITISTANALILMTAVANALPATVPATPGVLWNNGGVIQLS